MVFLWLCLLCAKYIGAQNIAAVIEYRPAPGQYINTSLGNMAAAESLIGADGGMVSLGAYGGYIILKMNKAIENDPNNPYGVDFTIFGIALASWSEAAAVMVMKDENANGLADDQWYNLAGSDYYWADAIHNYFISYTNPQQEQAAPVPWRDNYNGKGIVPINNFHTQAYYPMVANFPSIPQDFYHFTGELLNSHYDCGAKPYPTSYPKAFGYADNLPKENCTSLYQPDNPYTSVVEGCGGDAMDISWAVDETGKYVNLDCIHFVKIYTAVNDADRGVMGEISTEITGVADVNPQEAWVGETNYLHLKYFPPRLLKGTSFNLEAMYFEMGKPSNDQYITYESSDEAVVSLSNQQLRAVGIGDATITAHLNSNPSVSASYQVRVLEPTNISISIEPSLLSVGDSADIHIELLDHNSQTILPLPHLQWHSGNAEVASVGNHYDQFKVYANAIGETYISVAPASFPHLVDSVKVVVKKQDGIDDVKSPIFSCYPNPAQDMLSLSMTNSAPQLPMEVSIFGLQGNLILHTYIHKPIIDISHLQKGIYILKIKQAEDKSHYLKFIKN